MAVRRARPGLMRLLLALLLALPTGLLGEGVHPALAAAGDLDLTFDGDGIVVNGLPRVAGPESVTAAVQPDGKIVGAWSSPDPTTGRISFAAARFLPDGRLDPAFGAGGTVHTDMAPSGPWPVTAMTLQADGKVIVAGRAPHPTTNAEDFALVRFTLDGRLDTAFGSGGKVYMDIGPGPGLTGPIAESGGVVIQADGKIVAGSFRLECVLIFACGPRPVLARYHPDGGLDIGFGSGGKALLDAAVGSPFRMVVQPDGKIVIAGLGGPGHGRMIRVTSDGAVDGSFGSAGEVGTVSLGALALQADGKLVVAGPILIGVHAGGSMVARYTPSGSPDPTFGVDGSVITSVGQPTHIPDPSAVVVQADGKIVVAGGGDQDGFVLVRHTPRGGPDPTFGSGERVTTTSPAGTLTRVTGLALQPDGKLVAAGGFIYGGNTYLALARYQTAAEPGVGGKDFKIGTDMHGDIALGWAGGTDQTGYLLARSPSAVWPLPADAGGYVDTSPAPGPALNCYQLFALGTSAVLAASDALCVQRSLFDQNRQLFHFTLQLNQTATAHMTWTALTSHLGYVLLALPQGGAPRAQPLAASATTVDDPTGGVSTCYVLYAVYESELDNTDLTCALPGHSSFDASSPSAQRSTAAGPQVAARTAAESLTNWAATVRQDVTTKLPAGRVKVEEVAARLRARERSGAPGRAPTRGR